MAEKKLAKKSTASPKERKRRLSDTIISALITAVATIVAVIIALPRFNTLANIAMATQTPTPLPIGIVDSKGVQMRLIQGGVFYMGSDAGNLDNQPRHRVYLDEYYIDVYEVTNSLYQVCVSVLVCDPPINTSSHLHKNYFGGVQYDNYPVVWVNWSMANDYCQWRGARLPTEAEWEKAARGEDNRMYPWVGNTTCKNANYASCAGDTMNVGLYEDGKSVYGIYDMAGNVAEWVQDWYSDNYYSLVADGVFNPHGPENGKARVIRGGSWYAGIGFEVFARQGYTPTYAYSDIGFRCAHDAMP